MQQQQALTIKYIVIGDTGVGKSSLIMQFTQEDFKEQHNITVGVEFGSRTIKVNGDSVKLQIWDTAGQEDFRSIVRSYYRSTAGALVVYDISRRNTFNHISRWVEEATNNGNSTLTFMLIGNKSDLEDDREVSYEEGEKLAKQFNMQFIETSAKTRHNVEQSFCKTAAVIMDKVDSGLIDVDNQSSGVKKHVAPSNGQKSVKDSPTKASSVGATIGLTQPAKKKKKSDGCC